MPHVTLLFMNFLPVRCCMSVLELLCLRAMCSAASEGINYGGTCILHFRCSRSVPVRCMVTMVLDAADCASIMGTFRHQCTTPNIMCCAYMCFTALVNKGLTDLGVVFQHSSPACQRV
jgi:hypothetical protein